MGISNATTAVKHPQREVTRRLQDICSQHSAEVRSVIRNNVMETKVLGTIARKISAFLPHYQWQNNKRDIACHRNHINVRPVLLATIAQATEDGWIFGQRAILSVGYGLPEESNTTPLKTTAWEARPSLVWIWTKKYKLSALGNIHPLTSPSFRVQFYLTKKWIMNHSTQQPWYVWFCFLKLDRVSCCWNHF